MHFRIIAGRSELGLPRLKAGRSAVRAITGRTLPRALETQSSWSVSLTGIADGLGFDYGL